MGRGITATDGADETIIAGKMIQGQQAASSNNVSSTNTDVGATTTYCQ